MKITGPTLLTVLGLAFVSAIVWRGMVFATGALGISPAYWLVPIFGFLGGVVGSLLRNDNKLILCHFESPSAIHLGTLGDTVLGLGGAISVVFLFGGTLRFDPKSPESFVMLISVSLISGAAGGKVVDLATKKMLKQVAEETKATAKQEARTEARAQMGTPAAAAYTADARDALNRGMPPEKALESTNQALVNDPKYVNAYLEKGRALKRMGMVEKALEVVEDGLKIKPDDPRLLYNRACYNSLLKKPNAIVLADLKKSFELLPGLRKVAETDNDLEEARNLPEFKQL